MVKNIHWVRCETFRLLDLGPNEFWLKSTSPIREWPIDSVIVKVGKLDNVTRTISVVRVYCMQNGRMYDQFMLRFWRGMKNTIDKPLITTDRSQLTDLGDNLIYINYIADRITKINDKILAGP